MKRSRFVLATALASSLAIPAIAQDHSGHGSHAAPTASAPADPAATAYKAAMDKMHADMMAVQPSGNADIDFVRGMIPHHQAAVDMAKIQLQFGKDPEIRKLSEEVIAAQEREIKQMQDWLAKNGG